MAVYIGVGACVAMLLSLGLCGIAMGSKRSGMLANAGMRLFLVAFPILAASLLVAAVQSIRRRRQPAFRRFVLMAFAAALSVVLVSFGPCVTSPLIDPPPGTSFVWQYVFLWSLCLAIVAGIVAFAAPGPGDE